MRTRKISTMLAAVAVGALTLGLALPASAAPPDHTAPTVNINNGMQPVVLGQLTTSNPGSVPVTIGWSQYDASGICAESGYVYDYESQTDPAQFESVQTSVQFTATVGHDYYIEISAQDCSPNANSSDTDRYVEPLSLSQEGAATYSPGWTTSNCNCFSGGTVLHTTKKNATASFQYSGYGVSWVTEKASNRGTANVYLDGVKVSTVKLNNAALNSVVGADRYSNSSGTHTLKIVVVSGRVDVDAFLVS